MSCTLVPNSGVAMALRRGAKSPLTGKSPAPGLCGLGGPMPAPPLGKAPTGQPMPMPPLMGVCCAGGACDESMACNTSRHCPPKHACRGIYALGYSPLVPSP